MFYTECIGHRWARNAVNHKTLDLALQNAKRASMDCMEVRVYDCTESPSGTLIAIYRRGERF